MNTSDYSVKDFCYSYSISRTTFYREVYAGHIRTRKYGHRTFVSQSDAQRWIQGQSTRRFIKRVKHRLVSLFAGKRK